MDKQTKTMIISPLSRVRHAALKLAKLQLDVAKDVALEFVDEYGKVASAVRHNDDLPLDAVKNARDAARELRARLRRQLKSLDEICKSLDCAEEKMGDNYVEELARAYSDR